MALLRSSSDILAQEKVLLPNLIIALLLVKSKPIGITCRGVNLDIDRLKRSMLTAHRLSAPIMLLYPR